MVATLLIYSCSYLVLVMSSDISSLKIADVHTFGLLTLQSIGELLDIEGYEDMSMQMLIEEIEFLAGLSSEAKVVADLVLPY